MKKTLLALSLLILALSVSSQYWYGISAWGENASGQCSVDHGYDYKAISAGGMHSLALKGDNSLAAWGNNTWGQRDVPTGNDFTAICSGRGHNLALKADSSLVAWGLNDDGQCDAPAGNDFIAISAGRYHSLALRSDGSIAAWGSNTSGQATAPAGSGFTAIDAGGYHSLAIRADSSLVAWGDNTYGQCNVPSGHNFIAVSAGKWHSLALLADRTVIAWGDNSFGQCDFPLTRCIKAIAAGADFSMALLTNDTLMGCGNIDNNHLNSPNPAGYTGIAAGDYHGLALSPPYELPWHSFMCQLTEDYHVEIYWSYPYQINLLGFNIYRSRTYSLDDTLRINPELITQIPLPEESDYLLIDDNVDSGILYLYWLEAVYAPDSRFLFGPESFSIPEPPVPPVTTFSTLSNVFPNPVRRGRNAYFLVSVKSGENGTVSIFNTKGQVVKTYHLDSGSQVLSWDGKDCTDGVYFCRLVTPTAKETRKLVLLK